MARPTLSVEIAFASRPTDPDIWTDVSAYVMEIGMTRGKTSFYESFDPGTLQLVLDNRDRRFEPFYSGSPYYPNVTVTRRIRVRATYAGTTYPVFDGTIESLNQRDEGGFKPTCEVTATDGFKVLSGLRVPDGDISRAILGDGPTAYYRLGDDASQSGAVDAIGDSSHNLRSVFTGSSVVTFGVPGLVLGDADTAAAFPGGNSLASPGAGLQTNTFKVPTYRVSCEGVFSLDPSMPAGVVGQPLRIVAGVNGGRLAGIIPIGSPIWGLFFIYLFAGSGIPYTGYYPAFTFGTAKQGAVFFVAKNPAGVDMRGTGPYHIVVTYDGLGQDGRSYYPTFYINGVASFPESDPVFLAQVYAQVSANVGFVQTSTQGKFYNAGNQDLMLIGTDSNGLGYTFKGTIDEVAIYIDKVLSPDRVKYHYSIFQDGWAQEGSGARVNHVLDVSQINSIVAFPPSRRDVATGDTQVPVARMDNSPSVELIRRVEKTEGGGFFFARDGKATFRNRNRLDTPAFTLSDWDVPGAIFYTDLESYAFDANEVANDVRVQYEGVERARADTASMQAYLRNTLSMDDLWVASVDDAQNAADYWLQQRKDVRLRPVSVTVRPVGQDAVAFPALLDLELLDFATIVRHPPPGSGTPITMDVEILRITLETDGSEWEYTLTMHPAPMASSPWASWVLPDVPSDPEAAYSVLGVTTRVGW